MVALFLLVPQQKSQAMSVGPAGARGEAGRACWVTVLFNFSTTYSDQIKVVKGFASQTDLKQNGKRMKSAKVSQLCIFFKLQKMQ